MGRGLGIFPARPKTPFVPGEATIRDKRSFCPGWWIHPGQKGGPFVPGEATTPYISFLPPSPFPQTLVSFGAAAVRSPAPPTALELPEHRRRRRRRPEPRCVSPTSPSAVVPASAAAVDAAIPAPTPCHLGSPPRPPLSAHALVFAAPGGLHCTPPRRHPLRCAPPRRQLPASSSRAVPRP